MFSAPDSKIEEIRWRHKLDCDLARSAIKAGYIACQLGIPLTNYMNSLEAGWDKLLKDRIAEAEKR